MISSISVQVLLLYFILLQIFTIFSMNKNVEIFTPFKEHKKIYIYYLFYRRYLSRIKLQKEQTSFLLVLIYSLKNIYIFFYLNLFVTVTPRTKNISNHHNDSDTVFCINFFFFLLFSLAHSKTTPN